MHAIARNAVVTAAVVTAASIPRLLPRAPSAGALVATLVLQLLLLVLVADAPMAWGARAGMAGALPDRSRLLRALPLALLLAAVAIALHLATDPALAATLLEHGRSDLHAQLFPATPGALLAAVLWVGGMEALFFYGFVVSLLARAFDRRWVAILGAVLLRSALSVYRLAEAGLLAETLPALGAGVLTSLGAAWLFTRGGLPAASLFLAAVKARHFLP